MLKGHLANPGVLRVLHGDSHPRMIFISGIGCIERGLEPEVFDADMANASGPGISSQVAAGEVGVERSCDWIINADEIALDRRDGAVPCQIAAAGFPTATLAAAKVRGPQCCDPLLCARTRDEHSVTNFQATGVVKGDALRANGNVIVFNLPSVAFPG